MSDGASEGYRWARQSEARQKKIDAFFTGIAEFVEGTHGDALEELMEHFTAFDAIRYEGHISRGRIEKKRAARWRAFQRLIEDTRARSQTLEDHHVRSAWSEILVLAVQFASPKVVERIQDLSPYKAYHLVLYVPNGTAHGGGRRDPTIIGNLASALDALASRPGGVRVVHIDDPERAVVGIRGLGAEHEEVKEPERAKLRFLAVFGRGVE